MVFRVFCGVMLAAFLALPAAAQSIRVYSVSPQSVQAGDGAFPLVLNGSGFPKNAVVSLGQTRLETTEITFNRIRAIVPAGLVSSPALSELTVSARGRRPGLVPFSVSPSPVGNYDWAALTAKLQTYVSNRTPLPADSVRGLTVMIARHGRIIYAEGFGNQTVDSVLPIASSTKFPSMLAVMTLVDSGSVGLDTPITETLAGYATVPADKQSITLRMLMNHTSGLPQPACLADDSVTLRQCVQQILNSPLSFAPGTQFAYGGGSMHVAGGVVEAVTGQPWTQYFNDRIGAPLGLTRYTYGPTANPRIAGGASTDVGDYTKMMRSFLAAGLGPSSRVISGENFNEMIRDQRGGLPVAATPYENGEMSGYSYGWWHSSPLWLASQPAPRTAGPELSDQGLFGCTPVIDLGYNYSAIILIQRNVAAGSAIWKGIRPLIVEQMQANP